MAVSSDICVVTSVLDRPPCQYRSAQVLASNLNADGSTMDVWEIVNRLLTSYHQVLDMNASSNRSRVSATEGCKETRVLYLPC